MFDYYQISNIIGSVKTPGAVHLNNNATARYFARYLFEKAISVFKWELPDHWDKDYFLYVLYMMGYIAVIPTEKYGVIPQFGTINGFNIYFAPRNILVSNPLLPTKEYIIHEECEIFKLQGNYCGIYDLIAYYAGKAALFAEAVDMNLINSKSSKIFFTSNKAGAESLKKVYDQIASGNPAAVIDKALIDPESGKLTWEWFSDNLQQNYIVSDLLIDLRKLENQFCTDLGIPNTNTDKRERLTDDEVNSNNVETSTRAELWLERLKECAERVNNMYDLNISVDWRVKPNEGNSISVGSISDGRNNS